MNLDPEDSLLVARLLMAPDIDCARNGLQVWACRGCEARRKGILGQQRLAQSSEACRRCGFVVCLGAVPRCWHFNGKIGDDLVGRLAALRRLERAERFDLSPRQPSVRAAGLGRGKPAVGFFLNMLCVPVFTCRGNTPDAT